MDTPYRSSPLEDLSKRIEGLEKELAELKKFVDSHAHGSTVKRLRCACRLEFGMVIAVTGPVMDRHDLRCSGCKVPIDDMEEMERSLGME